MNLKDMPLRAKIIMVIFMIIVVIISILLFLPNNDDVQDKEEGLVNPNKEKITRDFVDIRYTRTTDSDTEYITFKSDGSFSYSCSCGNAVDNYDLCEYYTVSNSVIDLVCYNEPGIIRQIIISEEYKDKLVLDFAGETREFHKEVESEE